MSINAFGIFVIDNNISLQDSINLAYDLKLLSVKSKFGLQLGSNISIRSTNFIKEQHGFTKNEMRFEITDDPLDCNAETLFGGYDPEETEYNLEYRLHKIKSFLNDVFATNIVKQVYLYINLESGDEYSTHNISLMEFEKEVFNLFLEEEGWTPSIKVVINS